MIIKILLALTALAAVFTIIVALRPSDFRISRSITIAAPPEFAFQQVNDLHQWQQMSPYAPLDPDANYTFEGPARGTGASLAWRGNSKVGEGKMTITESRSNEFVGMELAFAKPMNATNTAEFTFTPFGDGTRVTWSLYGHSKFVCKAMGTLMDMDKMIGRQFEEGLGKMKRIAERNAGTHDEARLAVAHR